MVTRSQPRSYKAGELFQWTTACFGGTRIRCLSYERSEFLLSAELARTRDRRPCLVDQSLAHIKAVPTPGAAGARRDEEWRVSRSENPEGLKNVGGLITLNAGSQGH